MSSSSDSDSDSESNQQTIWEILNTLETKLIGTLLPQIIDTSQQLVQDIHSKSKDIIQNVIIPAQQQLLLIPKDSSQQQEQQIDQILQSSTTTTKDDQVFFKLFKPRRILILTGLYFTGRFTLRLFLNSAYFDRWCRSNPAISQRLPYYLNPTVTTKNIKGSNSHRLQVIVILGADPGSAGHQIALHLTQIGYIVIASVSRAEYVTILERDGLGWLKALVLDPLILNQTRPFLRSLAASLNLKFPLNSFSTPTNSNDNYLLIGLINCLPISFPDVLRPIESLDIDLHLISPIQSITGTSLEVIKVVLPMIRNSIEKFGANDGIILTLFPIKTTSVALPHLGSSLIANQTLETLMTTLRREMMISHSDSKRRIRIINEKIGTFRPSQHFTGGLTQQQEQQKGDSSRLLPSLPIHLHSIYAPSLSRRIGILGLPCTGLAILSTKGSPISQLIKRVEEIIQSSSIGYSIGSSYIGRESLKFTMILKFLPNFLVESWLKFNEILNGWVRKKILSNEFDLDLESKENLEKIIQKRSFSSKSNWKTNIIFPSEEENHQQQEEEQEIHSNVIESSNQSDQPITEVKAEVLEVEGEGDVTVQETLPNPPQLITPTTDQPTITTKKVEEEHEIKEEGEEEGKEETGSIIDKGEEISSNNDNNTPDDQHLTHSFVGSEIDWNENKS